MQEDPISCFHMYTCTKGVLQRRECPGMAFDPKLNKCTWSEVKVCENHRLKNKLPKAFVWEGIADQFGDKVFDCNPGNYFRLPHNNCSQYYECYDGDKKTLECVKGFFSSDASTCNWSEAVCREEEDEDDYYDDENDLRIVIGEEVGQLLDEEYVSSIEKSETVSGRSSEDLNIDEPEDDETVVNVQNDNERTGLNQSSKVEASKIPDSFNQISTQKSMQATTTPPLTDSTHTITYDKSDNITNTSITRVKKDKSHVEKTTGVGCEPLERVIDPESCIHYYECISGRFKRQKCPEGMTVSFIVGWRRPSCSINLQTTICKYTQHPITEPIEDPIHIKKKEDETDSSEEDPILIEMTRNGDVDPILSGTCDREGEVVADPASTKNFFTCVDGNWQRRFCGDYCFPLFQLAVRLPT